LRPRPPSIAARAGGCCGAGRGRLRPGRWVLPMLPALALLSACSSGSGSPLDSASVIEREFVIAAVTWDLNKDGNVTCDEWKQYVTGLFREADTDHDGTLTREEYAALSRRDRLFETVGFNYFDANGDGRISLSEMVDKPNPAFTLLDKNHDCVLTPDERVQSRGPREDAPAESGKLPPLGTPGG
jgi:hypothetical protein